MPSNGFLVKGNMDFEVVVEGEDAEECRKAVEKAVRVTLYHEDDSEYKILNPEQQAATNKYSKFMEVDDANVNENDTETEETEL